MVVRISVRITLISWMILSACNNGKSIRPILLFGSGHNRLIAKKYYTDTPLAQLINMDIMSTVDTSFELHKATEIQIYATGEMDTRLADVPVNYFYKSDDIEMFIGKVNSNEGKVKPYVFSWTNPSRKSDTCRYVKDGIHYINHYDPDKNCYTVTITFPFNAIGNRRFFVNQRYPFDVALGDNDDNLQQKAKVTWNSPEDPLYKPVSKGSLLLALKPLNHHSSNNMYSVFRDTTTQLDSNYWSGLPSYPINRIVIGTVKNSADLSGVIKSCWNEKEISFLLTVNDTYKGQVILKDLLQFPTLHDYGWIEDSKGKRVWDMHLFYTHHAGGALKNQQADTTIKLKAGKYKLKYTTDESHSWNNWDDAPPLNVFYGIVLYDKK